jgi:DNA-binding NarL/FixJ family response regulator
VVDLVDGATPRLLAMAAPLAWLAARAQADLAQADLAQTTDVVTDLVDLACGPQALPGAQPGALRLLCLAEMSRHDATSGPPPWVEAVAALDGAQRPYLSAYARWRLAQAQVTARQHAAAADTLRRSHAVACRLGAAPLVAQVESLARRTRVDLRAPVDVPAQRADAVHPKVAALTSREREILGHLAAGRTNGEIARALVISTKTASVHVSNILRKLGVSTRYEAAELAERLDVRPTAG